MWQILKKDFSTFGRPGDASEDCMKSVNPHAAEALVLVLIVLILVACYLPVVLENYGYADDFPMLHEARSQVKWIQPAMTSAGRPIGGAIIEYTFRAAGTIGNLRYLRGASVLALLLLTVLMYRHFLKYFDDGLMAALSAAFISTLVPFQVYVGWASPSYGLVGVLLTFPAYHCLRRCCEATVLRCRIGWFLAAMVGLVLSLFTYQPAAMFLWFWIAVDLLLMERLSSNEVRQGAWAVSLFAGSLLTYFAIYRMLGLSNPRATLSHDVFGKLHWFGTEVMRTVLRMQWIDDHSKIWPIVVVLVILVAGLIQVRREGRMGLVRLVLMTTLVPLSYTANLAAADSWHTYRTQIALMPVVGVWFWFSLTVILRRVVCSQPLTVLVLSVALCVGVLKTNSNMMSYFVIPHSMEYRLLKSELRQANLAGNERIYVIKTNVALPETTYFDEFGFPTSATPSEWGMLKSMTILCLQDLYPSQGQLAEKLIVLEAGQSPPSNDTNMVVVDMRRLGLFR